MLNPRLLVMLCDLPDADAALDMALSALSHADRPFGLRFAVPEAFRGDLTAALPPGGPLGEGDLRYFAEAAGLSAIPPLISDETHFLRLSGVWAFAEKWDRALYSRFAKRGARRAVMTAVIRGEAEAAQAYLPALSGFTGEAAALGAGLALVCSTAPVKTLLIDPRFVWGEVAFPLEAHGALDTLSIAAFAAGYAVFALDRAPLWPAATEGPTGLGKPTAPEEPARLEAPAAPDRPIALGKPAALDKLVMLGKPADADGFATVSGPALAEETAAPEGLAALGKTAHADGFATVRGSALAKETAAPEGSITLEWLTAPDRLATPERPAMSKRPADTLAKPGPELLPPTVLARFEQLAGFSFQHRTVTERTRQGLFTVEDTYPQSLPLRVRARELAHMPLRGQQPAPLAVTALIDLPERHRPPQSYLLRFTHLMALRNLPLVLYAGGTLERQLRARFANTLAYPDNTLLPRAYLGEGMEPAQLMRRSKLLLLRRAQRAYPACTHLLWLDCDLPPHPLCPDAPLHWEHLLDERAHLAWVDGEPDGSMLVVPAPMAGLLAREAEAITQIDVAERLPLGENGLLRRLVDRFPDLFVIHPMPARELLFFTCMDPALLSAPLRQALTGLPQPIRVPALAPPKERDSLA